MKSKVSKYFEVKIQYMQVQDNGKIKKVTEQYAVEALSFTEAESRIIEEMSAYAVDEFDVIAEKIAPYNEIFISEKEADDKWFVSKVSLLTIDEKTEKEKKQTIRYLVQAVNSERALEYTKDAFASFISDYCIDAVQDTPTLDVFFNDEKQATANTATNDVAESNF